MEEKIQFKLSRNEIFTLFNSLLVREKSIFKKQNKDWELLLNRLWCEVDDKSKRELLWSKRFRKLLESWNIAYIEDLNRIGIPLDLEEE